MANIESILSYLIGRQAPTCKHAANVAIFYFYLTCDDIGDSEVNKIKCHSTSLAGLSNAFGF